MRKQYIILSVSALLFLCSLFMFIASKKHVVIKNSSTIDSLQQVLALKDVELQRHEEVIDELQISLDDWKYRARSTKITDAKIKDLKSKYTYEPFNDTTRIIAWQQYFNSSKQLPAVGGDE